MWVAWQSTCKLYVDNILFGVRVFDTNHAVDVTLVLCAKY